MCDWFRQVEARGRDGGLGPEACLLPSHMQEDLTGLRKGLQRLRDGARCRERGARRSSRGRKSRCSAERRLSGPLWGVCNGYMLQRFRLPLA